MSAKPPAPRRLYMLELYNTSVSTCSQKVRLALAEKDLEFTDRQVSLRNNEQLSDWYLKLNPNGVVPTLVHDGRAVIDSSVINEYLEESFPEVPLLPREPWLRARAREWRQYIDEVPTHAIRIPSFNAFIVPQWGKDRTWAATRQEKAPLRKSLYKRLGPDGYPKEDLDDAMEKLRQTVERMDASLKEGPWLAGGQFTLADISMTPNMVRLYDLGRTDLWKDLPQVVDWFERVQRRPSFARAYYAGSRMSLAKR
jgi:glutathione S-transferase